VTASPNLWSHYKPVCRLICEVAADAASSGTATISACAGSWCCSTLLTVGVAPGFLITSASTAHRLKRRRTAKGIFLVTATGFPVHPRFGRKKGCPLQRYGYLSILTIAAAMLGGTSRHIHVIKYNSVSFKDAQWSRVICRLRPLPLTEIQTLAIRARTVRPVSAVVR